MAWRGILLISALMLNCNADFDVSLANYCGQRIDVGEKFTNGFITLYGKQETLPRMPDTCVVEVVADPGYAIYMRFKEINFANCDERVKVLYQPKDSAPENVFDSTPHFCGKEIISATPVMVTYDDESTRYRIEYTKGSSHSNPRGSLVFDYTAKLIGDGSALVWPVVITDQVTTELVADKDKYQTTPDTMEEATSSTVYDDTTEQHMETSTSEQHMETSTSEQHMETSTSEQHMETSTSEQHMETSTTEPYPFLVWTTEAKVKSPAIKSLVSKETDATTKVFVDTTFAEKKTTEANIEITPTYAESTVEHRADTTVADVQEKTTTDQVYTTEVTETSTKATLPPAKGPFHCTCSVGFEKGDGSHHLLEDFPGLIPSGIYTIPASSCVTAQQKCDSFCRIMVVGNLGPDGLKQFKLGADFLSHLSPSLQPKPKSTIGGFVCGHHKTPMSGKGAKLSVFSHLPQCNSEPQDVKQLAENFCCDGKGNHVLCAPPLASRCACVINADNSYGRDMIGNVIPPPKPITISSVPYCTAGSKQCVQYCKSAAYHLITNKAEAFSHLSGTTETVGDRVCDLSGVDRTPSNPLPLYLMSSLQCPSNLTSMVASLGQICCRNKQHTSCDSYHPPTIAPPSFKCQCTPQFQSGLKSKTFDAVHKAIFTSSGGCSDAEKMCVETCRQFSTSGGLTTKWKIADKVCSNMGTFALKRGSDDQTLHVVATIHPSVTCMKPAVAVIADTIVSRDFCCSGGINSQYLNCSNLPASTTGPPTRNWWQTTPWRSTAQTRPTVQCQCSPKYVRGATTYKTFPAMFTTSVDFSRGCSYASSLCRQECVTYFQSGLGGRFGSLSTTSINRQIINDTCGQLQPQQPMDYSKLQIHSTLRTTSCHVVYSSSLVKTITNTYCCYKGQYASCTGRQPRPSTPAPTVNYGYQCQCKPLYFNNTAGLETESRFSSIYNISIPYNYGCSYARSRCKSLCASYLSRTSTTSTNKIADRVCHQIYTPFKVKQPYQSFLEIFSLVNPAQCPGSKDIYVQTLSQSFCCSGAGGSKSSYVKCSTIEQQRLGTSRRPSYTTKRPYYSTGRPSSSVVSCQCTLGLRYSSSGYTFKSIPMTSIIKGFPTARYTSSITRSCTIFSNTCESHCLRTANKYIQTGVMNNTPYGYKSIDDAVCLANRRTVSVPFDLQLKANLVGTRCPMYYTTVKTYDRDICCTAYRSTRCITNSVVG